MFKQINKKYRKEKIRKERKGKEKKRKEVMIIYDILE